MPRWPVACELVAAALLTAFVVVLHVRHFAHAGPLWRDEISTVAIANVPTYGELYRSIVNDWTPVLWDGVVRAWTWAGPGRSDAGLRALGLGMGLGITAALWLNARLLGARTPVLSLVMLGMNGLALCYGDSLRAYGPGMLAGLLVTAALFHLSQVTGRRRTATAFAAALAAAVASVNTNYFDSTWLLAASLGAVAVCAAHGRWRRALGILAVGALAGASLSAYAHVMRARAGMRAMVYPTDLSNVVAALHLAPGRLPMGDHPARDTVWRVAIGAAVAAGCGAWWAARSDPSPAAARRRDGAVFSLVTLVIGTAAFVTVLHQLGDSLAYFHFLILIALMSTCLDGLLAAVARPGARLVLTAAACAVAVAWSDDAWRSAGVRMSNADLVARRLDAVAHDGDLVLIDPWWMGCSLARYYHGPARLMTIPPMDDLRFQRFDLAMPMLDDPHAIDPVLDRLSATARAGRRVWVVIHPTFTLAGDPTKPLPEPSPTWDENDYYARWTQQVSRAIQRDFGVHRVTELDVDAGVGVSPYEDLQLLELTP